MHRTTAIARYILLTMAVVLLAFGAIGGFLTIPKMESTTVMRPLVVVVLDASTSMLAAADGGNRLDVARKAIADLAYSLADSDVALVTFGGDALVDFPPSPDRDGFLAALDAVKPTLSFSPGSDATTGLTLAQEMSAGRQAVAVLFTDGEFNVPDENLLRTAWMSRTIPLAWRVVGIGPAMPIPLGGSWFRDPDSGEIALSQASDETLKELVKLSDAPQVPLLANKTAACAATVKSLLEDKDAQPELATANLAPGLRVCAFIAAILIVAAMLLGHFAHAPVTAWAAMILLMACSACSRKPDGAYRQAERLTALAIQEWELAEASKQPSEALDHIRRGLALCREVVRLVPQDESASANLRLFLSREAQLRAPQDEAPATVEKEDATSSANASSAETSSSRQSTEKPAETIADDVLGLAGDAGPARMLPEELREKGQPQQNAVRFTPQDSATADAWRSLLQKERGMRKRPQNVKPW